MYFCFFIITSRSSNIYVSDSKNGLVKVFNKSGNFKCRIDGFGNKKFSSPRGVHFCEDRGCLLVTDFELHKLVSLKIKYDNNNQVMACDITFYNSLFLKRPQSVDYRDGVALIANSRSYEVVMFDLDKGTYMSIPNEKTGGIFAAGVCFAGEHRSIFATDVSCKHLIKFETA